MKFALLLAATLSAGAAHADLKLKAGQTISISQGYPGFKAGAGAAEQATQITVCTGEKCESHSLGKPVSRLEQFQLNIAADLINAHLSAGKSMNLDLSVTEVLARAADMKAAMPAGVRKYVESLEKRTAMAQVRVDAYESKFGVLHSPQVESREPSSR